MDYIKVEMCAYLLLTVLCMVVDVRSNAIPAFPSVYFPSDCKGLPNCNGGFSTLQNSMVKILTANHEYGRGIHSLHKLYGQLAKDFANLKDQLNSLEKKYVLDKLYETNTKQSTLKPFATSKPAPDIQVHGHVDDVGCKSLDDLFKNNHIWTDQEFHSFQTLFINITTNLRTQARRSSKLLKRVNSYRKDIKKYIHLVRHLDKKLLNHVDKDSFEENSRKQKTINSQLESRVRQLELLLNRPDSYLQRDGHHNTYHNIGMFTTF